ncbi:MAG: hypothetical protein AAFU61_01430 [Pseudomonadota bacterium]
MSDDLADMNAVLSSLHDGWLEALGFENKDARNGAMSAASLSFRRCSDGAMVNVRIDEPRVFAFSEIMMPQNIVFDAKIETVATYGLDGVRHAAGRLFRPGNGWLALESALAAEDWVLDIDPSIGMHGIAVTHPERISISVAGS